MEQQGTGRNRRKVAAIANLECLEARQLMAANPAQVGFQEDGTSGTATLYITGTNKADVIKIDDNGTGSTGNITVTLGNGNVYTTKSGVAQIEVLGKGGDDQVSYNLNGDLVAPRVVLVDLGAGNDKFTDNLTGAINSTTGFDLEVYGGAGNDTMTTNQTGATLLGNATIYFQGDAGNDTLSYNGSGQVASGASLNPEFSGGAGNDTIQSNYAGVINGNYLYNLAADGGAGNDNIVANVALAAGSTGSVGSALATPAAVEGGAGNDTIRFAVAVDPTASQPKVYAVAVGGTGKDIVSRTANVATDAGNEKTTILS